MDALLDMKKALMIAPTTERGSENADEWLSEPELRHRLRYSKSTISRLRKRGLPYVGTDRLRRYHWPTVIKWLSEHA